MSVTVVSCVYGDAYDRYVPRWDAAIGELDPAPDDVIVTSDRPRSLLHARVVVLASEGLHPEAFYLNEAIQLARSEWVWVVEIDDVALPDALAGLDDVGADVWLTGYERPGREDYLPPVLSNRELLLRWNPYAYGSPFRRVAHERVGGFDDIAYQDWGLWRKLARRAATFEVSGRTHFVYHRHSQSRTVLELGPGDREAAVAEMRAAEGVFINQRRRPG